MKIDSFLSDNVAELAGRKIAEDFGLKKSREHEGGFETEGGWFYPKGIGRRAMRHVLDAMEEVQKQNKGGQ